MQADDRSKLRRGVAYPLADQITLKECRRYGIKSPGGTIPEGINWAKIMAVWTGEKRAPKAGEWYLSGSPIDAYRAPNDLTQEFHIARLVRVETRQVQDIFELEEKGG